MKQLKVATSKAVIYPVKMDNTAKITAVKKLQDEINHLQEIIAAISDNSGNSPVSIQALIEEEEKVLKMFGSIPQLIQVEQDINDKSTPNERKNKLHAIRMQYRKQFLQLGIDITLPTAKVLSIAIQALERQMHGTSEQTYAAQNIFLDEIKELKPSFENRNYAFVLLVKMSLIDLKHKKRELEAQMHNALKCVQRNVALIDQISHQDDMYVLDIATYSSMGLSQLRLALKSLTKLSEQDIAKLTPKFRAIFPRVKDAFGTLEGINARTLQAVETEVERRKTTTSPQGISVAASLSETLSLALALKALHTEIEEFDLSEIDKKDIQRLNEAVAIESVQAPKVNKRKQFIAKFKNLFKAEKHQNS